MSTAGIPPEVLAQYPAMKPPLGVKSNFINPPSQQPALIILNAVFLALMVIVVAIRLYSKARILRTIGWDDYTCAMAALASTAHSVVMLNNLQLGYGRHLWDVRATTLMNISNVRRLNSTSIIYPIVIFLVKISILLLYFRIFGVNRKVRIAVYVGIVVLALFYLAYVGVQAAFMVDCVTQASMAKSLCKNVYPVTVFQSVFNVCSDFYVFIIPIPRIIDLQVTKRQKIGLLFIFLAGLIACLVSIARLVITAITLEKPDKLWNASLSSELTIVEINLAIIAACMSTMPGFFARSKLIGSTFFRSLRSRFTASGAKTSNSKIESNSNDGALSNSGNTYDRNYIELKEGSGSTNTLDTAPLRR
ncbi:hypothetical protein BGZ60DRAFT_532605 [Tricladium varicosporioides]|nr:hypothetical protein BGZ60DRAFT_532605 [Hymenoscyphus varicosporioides]